MFDILFNTLSAWNQIGLFLMALVFLLIGGAICSYELYWAIKAQRVRGRICGVRVKREVKGKGIESLSDENSTEALADAAKSQPVASAFFLLMFCGIPLIFVGFGAYQAYEYVSLTNSGEYAQATVIRNDKDYDSDGDLSYKAVLRFSDASGKSWEVKDGISYGSSPSYTKGTVIGVYYDGKDPNDFVIHDFWHHMAIAIIFMVFGSVFILFIPFMIWLGKRGNNTPKHKRQKRAVTSFKNEMYHAVFEYKAPNGERVECVSDFGSSSILGKIPGTPVKLLMFPNKPEKARRSRIFVFIIGLVFLLPGLFIMNVALTQFETNSMTFVLIFVGLVFVAYKIFDNFRDVPFDEMKKGWNEVKEQGVRTSTSSGGKGRLLDEGEIKPRIRAHSKNALISAYVMLVISLGTAVGGYYTGLNMIEFSQAAVATSGEVVGMKRNRSSGDSSDTFSAIVRFKDQRGQSYKFKDSVGSSHPSFKKGDAVDVMYMPNDPDDAMIDRGPWNWALSGGLWFGALLFLWGALASFATVRRYGGAKYRGRV